MKVIFVVQGYERQGEMGQLEDVVTFEVYAKNEQEAIKKAKQYKKTKFYRISRVIENDSSEH